MKHIYLFITAALLLPGLAFAQPANDNCSGALPIEVALMQNTTDFMYL